MTTAGKVEVKISKMKEDGKYLDSFIFIFGSTKSISLKRDNILNMMLDYLTKKGF